jgi:hypothetical protein
MYCVLFLHNTVCVWPQLQVIELGGLRKDGLGGGIDAVGSAGVGGIQIGPAGQGRSRVKNHPTMGDSLLLSCDTVSQSGGSKLFNTH